MCGITGIFGFKSSHIKKNDLIKMNDAITHRGPDGNDYYIDKNIGLGHKRLSIIDLSDLASQPMTSYDGRFVITYNGEIYNFQELKKILINDGYKFRSNSDTEVVLNAFSKWGTNCFKKFNGMFALAIWDKKNKELLVARDRYGIKPFYYFLNNKNFIFSSEIKSLKQNSSVKFELDKEGLVEYLTFQNFFTDKTLYKNIKTLEPGSFLKINSSGNISLTFYWDFNYVEDKSITSMNQAVEECDRLFVQAVKRQLVSDVEIGTYLSGGLDSGGISAIASKHIKGIKSYTVGFDLNSASGIELGFDERKTAEYMSYLFGSEHYQVVLKPGDMERVLPNVVFHLEEPRVGQSYPNFYAAKLASKFGKVVLSGTGGDEIFAGYPWRYQTENNYKNFDDFLISYFKSWQRLVSRDMLPKIVSPIWKDVSHIDTFEIFRNIFKKTNQSINNVGECVNNCLYLESKTFLKGLLSVEDKLSMAFSLENRVPFLDNELVDFACRLPVKYKISNLGNHSNLDENNVLKKKEKSYFRSENGKLILRKMMESYVPKTIYGGIKQGFSAPDASWFKGESINFVKRKLYNKNSFLYDILNFENVKIYLDQHMSGQHNKRLFIWSMLYLDELINTEFD